MSSKKKATKSTPTTTVEASAPAVAKKRGRGRPKVKSKAKQIMIGLHERYIAVADALAGQLFDPVTGAGTSRTAFCRNLMAQALEAEARKQGWVRDDGSFSVPSGSEESPSLSDDGSGDVSA